MCYTVPVAGAIVVSCMWARNKNIKTWWLNLMLLGGALFGVIDHLWNGELFLISENIVKDLLLGVVITVAIFLIWAVTIWVSKSNRTLASYVNVQSQKQG